MNSSIRLSSRVDEENSIDNEKSTIHMTYYIIYFILLVVFDQGKSDSKKASQRD